MRATREAFGEHLPVMGEKHNNIVALDADLGKATKIASFGQAHPDRFFQMGIAEANMIGVASGLSEYDYKVLHRKVLQDVGRIYDAKGSIPKTLEFYYKNLSYSENINGVVLGKVIS